MDAESTKPRINGSMLSSHMGQFVTIVGKNLGVSSSLQKNESGCGCLILCYW